MQRFFITCAILNKRAISLNLFYFSSNRKDYFVTIILLLGEIMQILSLQNVGKEFSSEYLFENITFAMNDKDRVALIGNNGCGKSTLLKMILGKEEISKGIIALNSKTKIGYLSQEVIENLNHSLKEEILSIFNHFQEEEKELDRLVKLMNDNPHDLDLINLYSKKLEDFTSNGGYDYHYKSEMMLFKFGFNKDDLNRSISSFSGGERTKIAFVKLLLIEPDLLILDEPTNHLDLTTIEWLESYLKNYSKALLFVSHDRYFIDALANKILEIENHTSFSFKGNYEDYIEEKKIRYESQMRAYVSQQKEIERMQRFIEFYRFKPRFVNRVHDREKKLEHMKKIDAPYQEKKTLKIHFKGDSLKNKELLEVKSLSIGYDYPLIDDISFSLYTQNRLAIMGDNGSGKTTLLKVLLEQLKPLKGEIIFKRLVHIGYIDQHQFDLKGEISILDYMMNLFPFLGEKKLRNHLGKFNFNGDDVFKSLDVLSGGEKMRLILAKIILNDYDLLVLDEPTNHLDMITRQALINALNEYNGTIIFVSHDRFFVDEIASHILYLTHNKAYFEEGSYQDFKIKEEAIFDLEMKKEEKDIVKIKKEEKTFSPLKLEEKIISLEQEIKELKDQQFLEENYMDYQKMLSLDKMIKEKEAELKKLEDLYLK